ncbi:sensor histidine kinase/response regulator [Anopheles sinensis]|uniref:Sensor histidine kinase/response regulator n=1 Tax=Anopheles sinensis TaxID=74873 RepID=A0A084VMY2_ANOSI|nr:sensor histidine kinase/response regulator [Anopheles sinensis]
MGCHRELMYDRDTDELPFAFPCDENANPGCPAAIPSLIPRPEKGETTANVEAPGASIRGKLLRAELLIHSSVWLIIDDHFSTHANDDGGNGALMAWIDGRQNRNRPMTCVGVL